MATLLLSTFIEFLQQVQQCTECHLKMMAVESFCGGIIFTYHASFFILAIACMWFSVKLMSTLEIQISVAYRYHITQIAKNLLYVTITVIVVYIFVIDGIIVNTILNKHQYSNAYSDKLKSVWVGDFSDNKASTNGTVYHFANISRARLGFYVKNATIFKIDNESIVSYKKYNNIFVSTHSPSAAFLVLPNPEDGMREVVGYKITKSGTRIIGEALNYKANHHGVYGVIKKITNNNPISNEELMSIASTTQVSLSFVLSFVIILAELISHRGNRVTATRENVLKVMVYLIISYTLCEVVKIIGTDSIYSQLTSTTLTLSLIFIFLSRAIKVHNQA